MFEVVNCVVMRFQTFGTRLCDKITFLIKKVGTSFCPSFFYAYIVILIYFYAKKHRTYY